jgi:ubiquinone/menaquinone biosynthesis C-methylase UbiE
MSDSSDSFSVPRENVLQMGLHEGQMVGEFGAGSGHYARAAAGIVGHSGRVYAVDVQEDVLKHVALNSSDAHNAVIETVWGDIETPGGSGLADASLDAIILANTLFQLDDRAGLAQEVKRVLRPGGKLLVVDWAGSYGGMGPAPDRVVPEHDAEDFFIRHGFHKAKAFRAGPHHYGLLFTL